MLPLEHKSINSKDLKFKPLKSIGFESSQSFIPIRER